MNTIEQAAKRLAELKRAGYEVPVPDMPGAAAASPVSAQPAAADIPVAEVPVESPAVSLAPATATTRAKAPSSAVVQAGRSAVVETLSSSGRRSRE